MAENIPTTPGGALPPKPAEAAKVQPKKETVRINLPPKPTSAPTIKLPTLAPGSAPPAATAAAPVAAASSARTVAPPAPPPPGATPTRMAAPAAPAKPAATPAPAAPRPMPMGGVGLSTVDKALAIVAAVVSLAAAGIVAYLVFFLKDNPPS
jgi:hypothetical protein